MGHAVQDTLVELLANQWATLCFTLLRSHETWPLYVYNAKWNIEKKIYVYAPDKNRKNTHPEHTHTHVRTRTHTHLIVVIGYKCKRCPLLGNNDTEILHKPTSWLKNTSHVSTHMEQLYVCKVWVLFFGYMCEDICKDFNSCVQDWICLPITQHMLVATMSVLLHKVNLPAYHQCHLKGFQCTMYEMKFTASKVFVKFKPNTMFLDCINSEHNHAAKISVYWVTWHKTKY
jgi:hypothetical protein